MSSSDSGILTLKELSFDTVGRSSRVRKAQDRRVCLQMMLKSYILLIKQGQSSISDLWAKCHNCSSKQDGHVWKGHGTPRSPNCASCVPGRVLTDRSQKSAKEQLMGAVRPMLRLVSSPAVNPHVHVCAAMCRYLNITGRRMLLPYNTNRLRWRIVLHVPRFCLLYTSAKHEALPEFIN